jgi:hypothetical protein
MQDLGPNFYKKLIEVSASVGMPPENLLNVMGLESGFNPSVGKPGSAVGLVQILPKYLGKLGYKGSESDFRNAPPEEQLIYIEKLIKGNMNGVNGGKPFKSVTQYYLSNFLPACLKRQDIINEDPNAIIAAENPTELHIPNTSIEFEKKVYKQNSGLDSNHDGAITYGDLTNKLSQVANRSSFKNQISKLKEHTGYESKINTKINTQTNTKTIEKNKSESELEYEKMINNLMKNNQGLSKLIDSSSLTNMIGNEENKTLKKTIDYLDIEKLLGNMLTNVRASEKKYKQLYKTYLPSNNILIKIQSNDKINELEFGRLLCSVLDEELLSTATVHSDGNVVEVQSTIHGPQQLCYDTTKQLTDSLVTTFKCATAKLGGINIITELNQNKQSCYAEVNFNSVLSNYRMFLLKFANKSTP